MIFTADCLAPAVVAIVVQCQLNHPMQAREVISLHLVEMPRFDDARISGRDVNPPEFRMDLVVSPHNFHQASPLVDVHLELLCFDAQDHGRKTSEPCEASQILARQG